MSTILGYASTFDQQIQKLFANNEQGFAYDPNDLTTMFQDVAGTIPVTGAGQAVGLMLDKSGQGNHASQTASASRPILRKNADTGANYLEFDGSDDFLQTGDIDFTATNEITVIAGVRKLSDVNTGIVCELSPSSTGTKNTFALYAPYDAASKNFGFRARGDSPSHTTGDANSSKIDAPASAVLRGMGSISKSSTTLMINGSVSAFNNTSRGVGNFIKNPLYIGRRDGKTLPFNGHIYGLIGIGRLTTDDEIAALEKLIAKNIGVMLSV